MNYLTLIQKLALLLAIGPLLVLFQNCGGGFNPQDFESPRSLSDSANLGLQDCYFNNEVLRHGDSIMGFTSSQVPFGQLCSSVATTVSCSNAVVSPNNAFGACSVSEGLSCNFNGQTVISGSTIIAYQAGMVPNGSTCVSQMRNCTNGALDGSYTFGNCAVGVPATCSFNGQTLASGATASGFTAATVPYGSSCASVATTATCTNGAISPSIVFPSCSVDPGAVCSFNGQMIPTGQSVMAYAQPVVAPGEACVPETRVCTNGTLSGSPGSTYAACEAYRPRVQKISIGMYQACVAADGALVCWSPPISFSNYTPNYSLGATPQRPNIIARSGVVDVDVKSDWVSCHIRNGALLCTSRERNAIVRDMEVASSGATSIFIDQHGHAVCAEVNNSFGCYSNGAISQGIVDGRLPANMEFFPFSTDTPIRDAAATSNEVCFAPANGSLVCNWVSPPSTNSTVLVPSGVTKVSMSRMNVICAVVDNQLQCANRRAGGNGFESGYYLRPDGVRATNLELEVIMNDVIDVDVVSSTSVLLNEVFNYFARAMCVVRTNGAVVCWGYTIGDVWMPPRTYIPSGAVSVKVSQGADGFMVVQMADGTVKTKMPGSDVFVDIDLYSALYR